MSVKPVTIAFGDAYSDGSGWEWRVSLERGTDGMWEVRGEGAFDGLIKNARDIMWRDVAAAFDAIADELGEDGRAA